MKIEKYEKPVPKLYNKKDFLIVQIVLMLIEMIQVAGLKPYEDLYMKLRAMILRKPSSS